MFGLVRVYLVVAVVAHHLLRFVEPRIDALRDKVKRNRRSVGSRGSQSARAVPIAATDAAS